MNNETNQRQNNSQQKNDTHRFYVSLWVGKNKSQTRPYLNERRQYQEVECTCMFVFRFLVI